MNLLQETLTAITESGHVADQIAFIGSENSGHCCTWDEFQKLADVEYDHGFGSQEVASDLIVVFSDGTKLWRGEYDGSEWWEFSTPFVNPTERKPIKKMVGGMWASLADLSGEDKP
jgi:hypothetical protein